MDRLISADALIKRLKPYRVEYSGDAFPYKMMHDAFIYEVEQEPTVDVQPVRHGKWAVPNGHSNARVCSVCMMICHEDNAMFYNYCPNCGAKMDGCN